MSSECERRHDTRQRKRQSRTCLWKPPKNNKIEKMVQELLSKPIWQMTGCELVTLLNSSREEIGVINTQHEAPKVTEKAIKRYEYGIRGIAKVFGCSIPTANRIKRSGKINSAIMQVGRKIIVDADKALKLVQKDRKEGKLNGI